MKLDLRLQPFYLKVRHFLTQNIPTRLDYSPQIKWSVDRIIGSLWKIFFDAWFSDIFGQSSDPQMPRGSHDLAFALCVCARQPSDRETMTDFTPVLE